MAQIQAKRVYLQNENDEILLPYSAQALEDGEGNTITTTYQKVANLSQAIDDSETEYPSNKAVKTELEIKANTSFDNLSEVGEKHFLNKTQVANCLTEVPQNIKLELRADGNMCLLAGSVLTYGDGHTITIAEDLVQAQGVNATLDKLIIVYDSGNNSLGIYVQGDNVFSQDTQPTTTIADNIWLDTANKKMMVTHDTGASWYEIPMPIGVCSITPYVWKSLDQVFNGFGYIGQCTWVDKDVKCLFADGRNADGTCKNLEFTNPELTIADLSGQTSIYGKITYENGKIFLCGYGVSNIFEQDTKPSFSGTYAIWFDTSRNEVFSTDNGSTWNKLYSIITPNLTKTTANGNITSFKPKQPFRAADISTPSIQAPYLKATYVNGTSGYRIWSDGYCEQWGECTAGTTITFAKTFANTNYNAQISCKSASNYNFNLGVNDRTVSSAKMAYFDSSWAGLVNWIVRGYLASGQY